MGRPITAAIPKLYTADLAILRQQFQPGRKVQISMRVEGADAVSTVKRTLRVIKTYPFYVLFRGSKGIRYTYTYPELVRKGLCEIGGAECEG